MPILQVFHLQVMHTTVIENDVLSLTISNKGGYVTQARLKKHTTYDSIPVYLIKDGNASLNFQFSAENRLLNTQELYFRANPFSKWKQPGA